VSRLINLSGDEKKVNFAEVIAAAKTKGYKLKKSEFSSNNLLMKFDGIYFRLPLLDSTFSIIDDGGPATVYHEENSLRPMTVRTSVGLAVILPIRYDGDPTAAGNIVIDVTEEGVIPIVTEEIAELINRRRRQILVHSIIYYKMDDNLIPDHRWSSWAVELKELQDKYPQIASECVFADAFEEFDPSTGYNLPLDDGWAVNKARYLLKMRDMGLYKVA
jgi:hypothetical protein